MIRFTLLVVLGALQSVSDLPPPSRDPSRAGDPAPPSMARLIRQRIEMGRRVCVYGIPSEVSNLPQALQPAQDEGDRNPGQGLQRRDDARHPDITERRVALAERCPFRDPREDSPVTRPIPALARLDRDSVVGNRRICSYVYLSRTYVRSLPRTRVCPLTPNLSD